ncbi:Hypothetical protein FKW44_015348 [Caligus rogercresseyi]|uniref:Uncharacterized protein n=1 Tax=Caligus rogercresseyi TaxID=217165 RepID=A0A7T8H075_CALRO|nr:Hypothetical protein FKW44_015348 [Caligus rogercresseyi]
MGSEISSSSAQQRKSREEGRHYLNFSLYPDRFNAPPPGNRMRTLSAGSDPLIPIEDDPVHPSAREIIEEEMEAAANKMKKSSTHQFAFFDYSMIPDKDPKAISKSS